MSVRYVIYHHSADLQPISDSRRILTTLKEAKKKKKKSQSHKSAYNIAPYIVS